jgi:signal transduction histidine kinase
MRPNSLAFRLFASAAAWTLVVLPVTAFLLLSLYRQTVERSFDARLNVYLTSLIASTTAEGTSTPKAPANLGEPVFTIPFSGWYWQIKPLEGAAERPLFVSDSLLDQQLKLPSQEGVPADQHLTRRAYAPGPQDQHLRVVEREIKPAGAQSAPYSYAVAGDEAEIERDLAEFRMMLIAALGVLGLGLVLATLFQVRFGLSPLRAIRHDLAAIRSGEAERLEGELPTEIRPLQQELNALIQSNREIVERARTHVGNLAHALKTPLSVITNEARERDDPLASKVVEQAELMRTQITHHLDRARVAARAGAIGDTTDVDGVLKGLKRALDRIYESRALQLTVNSSPGLKFQGEKQDFEEMVGNLLDNACKWARSHVWVSAERCDGAGNFEVLVDDDGPGLTGPDRAKASSPNSPISIRDALSLSPRRKGACAPASTCPRPNSLKNHRLLSGICDNSTQTMRLCPAQGWGCPFRTRVDGNNVFARGVLGDARLGADSGRGLRVVQRRWFPPRSLLKPAHQRPCGQEPPPCLHAGKWRRDRRHQQRGNRPADEHARARDCRRRRISGSGIWPVRRAGRLDLSGHERSRIDRAGAPL